MDWKMDTTWAGWWWAMPTLLAEIFWVGGLTKQYQSVGESVVTRKFEKFDSMGLVDECFISSGTLGNWYNLILQSIEV